MRGGRDVPINLSGLLSEESRALRAVSGSFLLNGDNQSNDMTPSGSRDPNPVFFSFQLVKISEVMKGYLLLLLLAGGVSNPFTESSG